jgi:large subunit ribosomal protein L9
MQVILLERVEKLGQMGEVVKVKDGFARNFLLPQKKALRATKDNVKKFEGQKAQLEARNLAAKKEAEGVAGKLDKQSFIILRQAGETGMLYGSVSTRDIADAITAGGVTVERNQVILDKAIKMLGLTDIKVQLHPEVRVAVSLNVARTVEEADRQARGENVLQSEAEKARAEADAMFEEAAAARAAAEAEEEAADDSKAEAKKSKKAAKADKDEDAGDEGKTEGKKKKK